MLVLRTAFCGHVGSRRAGEERHSPQDSGLRGRKVQLLAGHQPLSLSRTLAFTAEKHVVPLQCTEPAAPCHGRGSRGKSVTSLLGWLLGTGAVTWLWYMAAPAVSSGLVLGVASCLRWPPLPGTAALASSRLSWGIGSPTIPRGTASFLVLGMPSVFRQRGIPGGPGCHLSARALGAALSTKPAATASSGLARGI